MKVKVLRIGNSKGIRIPNRLLKQCGIGRAVDLRLEGQYPSMLADPGKG
jgi:antitoxin component of MazEF toxin-antitoxin module